MTGTPAISVIMSVHNGERYVYPAVRSILDQHFSDFEFLIVNDGSTDESGAILRELALTDTRIILIERENRGLIASLNELLERVKAPIIARMDCDDIAMPQRLARQLTYLEKHPDIAIVGSFIHELDEHGHTTAFDEDYPICPQKTAQALVDGPPLCHPSVMMRTALIRELGGYRAAFRHAEDYDLWLRASARAKMANMPETLLLYRRTDEQVSQKYHGQQAMSASVAWYAHQRRLAGKADPFEHIAVMPSLDEMDEIFGEQGAATAIRSLLLKRMRYAPEMLSGDGFPVMLKHVREGNSFEGAGRTILRLARSGKLKRSAVLALAFLV